ncbi:hypothetical protein EG878_14650 [Enterococcus faecalis]|nr:hypothetical protein EG878_14650 [Enterococcus faecalis]
MSTWDERLAIGQVWEDDLVQIMKEAGIDMRRLNEEENVTSIDFSFEHARILADAKRDLTPLKSARIRQYRSEDEVYRIYYKDYKRYLTKLSSSEYADNPYKEVYFIVRIERPNGNYMRVISLSEVREIMRNSRRFVESGSRSTGGYFIVIFKEDGMSLAEFIAKLKEESI